MSKFLNRERQSLRAGGLWLGGIVVVAFFAMLLANASTAGDAKISAQEKAQFEDAVSKFMAGSACAGYFGGGGRERRDGLV